MLINEIILYVTDKDITVIQQGADVLPIKNLTVVI